MDTEEWLDIERGINKSMGKPGVEREEYQSVVLTFSDGLSATYTGPAKVWPGDTRLIVGVLFTEPKPLPEGASFVEVGGG